MFDPMVEFKAKGQDYTLHLCNSKAAGSEHRDKSKMRKNNAHSLSSKLLKDLSNSNLY